MKDSLQIANTTFESRLFLGTGKFPSQQVMQQAVIESKTQLVTLAMRRIDLQANQDDIYQTLKKMDIGLLPNTSGAKNAKEAVLAAELGREALETNMVKLEIHPDQRYLLPDNYETLVATEILAKKGFHILPYIQADPVVCKQLEDNGASAVMPLGAPIGSNQGLTTKSMLEIIIAESNIPVVIDAGLGLPSHAAEAMEIGADAVLVNTAIAIAKDPIAMAKAFDYAVQAGRLAFLSKTESVSTITAQASSPLTNFLHTS